MAKQNICPSPVPGEGRVKPKSSVKSPGNQKPITFIISATDGPMAPVYESAPRRQGESRGNDADRIAGPPGFTIPRGLHLFYGNKRTYPPELQAQVAAAAEGGEIRRKKLGDKERPLLVSVRSGARDSMPGMMDTILNWAERRDGEILARQTNNPNSPGFLSAFPADVWRRGDGRAKTTGRRSRTVRKRDRHLKDQRYRPRLPDMKLTVADLKELVKRFRP
jgi:hypothetical protein